MQASELVLDKLGRVYHLGVYPEQIATTILLVGDQDRVAKISAFFDEVEHRSQHREFVVHTGIYKGKRISAISTGIGTDNIDIIINELDALVNIDLKQRTMKEQHTELTMVRIGTCGILQEDIPVHAYLLSKAALGLDNVAHFYEIPYTAEEEHSAAAINQHIQLPERVIPYYITSNQELTSRLDTPDVFKGITVTSSGFYGPQGRMLIARTKTVHLNERLTTYRKGASRIINFEMESSALFSLSRLLNHKSTTICLGIANRLKNQFSEGYEQEMDALIIYVLDRI